MKDDIVAPKRLVNIKDIGRVARTSPLMPNRACASGHS